MNKYKDKYKTQIHMNITSMMDVVFMLLIIFMIAAPLMRAEVDVKLPKSAAARVKDNSNLSVSITMSGDIFIGNEQITIDEFPEAIKKIASAGAITSVSLKGDESIDYGLVMKVVGYIKDAGIENLGLVATPEKTKTRR
jgi:biopolymer transport protein TolR